MTFIILHPQRSLFCRITIKRYLLPVIYCYQGKKKKKKRKTSKTSKEKPIHRCNSCHQVCANGGSCFYDEDNQRSHCVCALGWTGQTCLENINDCEVNQCQHGATCEDGMNEYRY